jgi:hypothetical protein
MTNLHVAFFGNKLKVFRFKISANKTWWSERASRWGKDKRTTYWQGCRNIKSLQQQFEGNMTMGAVITSMKLAHKRVRSYLLHSSLAGVRLCCAFYQPQQTVQICWAETILLSQTSMLWLFFIQLLCAGSHTEHHWGCSQKLSKSIPHFT